MRFLLRFPSPFFGHENGPSVYNRLHYIDYKSSHWIVIYELRSEDDELFRNLQSWAQRVCVCVKAKIIVWRTNITTNLVNNKESENKMIESCHKWELEEIQMNTFWFLSPTSLQIFLNAKRPVSSRIVTIVSVNLYPSIEAASQILSRYEDNK